jgi:hypothetical protein
MEDDIGPIDVRANRLAVPDVYLDEPRAAAREGPGDVRRVAAQQPVTTTRAPERPLTPSSS